MSEDGLDRDELLKDSEATLREVAGILLELRDPVPSSVSEKTPRGPPGGTEVQTIPREGLQEVLKKAALEVDGILAEVRGGRRTLQSTSATLPLGEGIQPHGTPEATRTGMLDGLDRAHSLVDQLVPVDWEDSLPEAEHKVVGDRLREELRGLATSLHFRDIADRELAQLSGALARAEKRLSGLTRLLELFCLRGEGKGSGEAAPAQSEVQARSDGPRDL